MERLYHHKCGTESGTPVSVSGSVIEVSGDVVFISGQPVQISGQSVFAYISGGDVHADISGDSVYVYVSGGSLTASISGQPVYVSTSGATVTVTPEMDLVEAASAGSGAVNLSISVADTHIVDYATYHATSGATTSSELYIQLDHGTSTGFYTKVFSIDMARYGVSNIYWYPDAKLWLMSGDSVIMAFSNPDACAYGATLRLRRV